MNNDQRFVELWNDYLEGELDENGIAKLQQLLASDARLLEAAADSLRTHRLLGLNAQDSESRHEDFVQATMAMLPADDDNFVSGVMRQCRSSLPENQPPRASGRFARQPWASAVRLILSKSRTASLVTTAVVAAVLLSCFIVLRPNPDPEVARITALHGPVQWTGAGGRVEEIRRVGRVLLGGTLESLNADSWAELQFRDGTAVTVSGRSLLTLSEQEQKILRLRYGNVSADVAPQPTGHPMLVHTPTADLQVLGTQFNVDAQPETTMLTVNKGHVRFQRLADRKVVDVSADHQAIASIDAQDGFVATPKATGVSAWRSDLETDVIHGKWKSDVRELAKQLKKAVAAGDISEADAIAKYKQSVTLHERGSVWTLPSPVGTLVLLSISKRSPAPVVVASRAKFRVQGNLYTPTDLVFGITTYAPDGGFAGKYSISFAAEELRSDGDTFDIELPLSDFRRLEVGFGDSPTGNELTDWWCHTKSNDAKLEITHVELVE